MKETNDSNENNQHSNELKSEEEAHDDHSDTESVKSEETKDEKLFIRCVRAIKNKFMRRKLIGKIYIYRSMGLITTEMQCHVEEKDYLTNGTGIGDTEVSLEGISGSYLQAVTMTESLLDSMERRAMKWDEVDFNNQVRISRGAKFSIGALYGMIGYTISYELEATLPSLINSRKRYLAKRHAAPEKGMMTKMASSIYSSLPFTGKKQQNKSLSANLPKDTSTTSVSNTNQAC